MFEISSFSVIAVLFVIVVVAFVYRNIVKPYQDFRFYKSILSKSYKTLVHPFSIIGVGAFAISQQDCIKHGDSQYTLKTLYPSYQISLVSFKGTTFIDLIDPELIRELYEKQTEGYYIKSLSNPFVSSLKNLIGNGLVFSEGEEWKMKRKIMSHVFNYDFIKSKIGLISKICQEKLIQVEETQINRDKIQVKIDISSLFQRIFGNVVVKSFFGDIQLDTIDGFELFSYFDQMLELNSKRVFTLFALLIGPNFFKYNLRKIDRQVRDREIKFKQFATDAVLSQIQQIKKEGRSEGSEKFNGVIELLVKQNKLRPNISEGQRKEEKNYYTIEDLIDQFTTFFAAGTDTTANSASMMIYLLAQNPNVEAKVRKQIDSVFVSPLNATDITYDKLKELTYFDDVMKETLRMYSPASGIAPRQAVKDHYIGSIPIKKGTLVGVNVRPNHFKEEFYSNPLEFNPERWSTHDPSKTEPFSYFPFSSGKRNCIGQHLALLQGKIAVVCLLKRYSRITLEKPNFKKYMRTVYAAEQMTTTFHKHQNDL